ncbi:hypothetical protein SAMD00019534_046080 [Acytostelium subglobosum LB1]|uniref:hypothetical protein n=1 Tax=Acytostelium subglobosum LB1 TaxID=1410327 RepID=UPI000644E78E|nr:hypothetical protein SAMD00019534_046080 [Acytostelium subglobosum LB1]GAM21433.1 hypothetical protein SAMD00019534_046080 [Acytostelium subglobosum LB1]|eukprot:XP_012755552.1 hypothetical protein SAMD00019534_046080 [Acytostelium subglobosum LB1]
MVHRLPSSQLTGVYTHLLFRSQLAVAQACGGHSDTDLQQFGIGACTQLLVELAQLSVVHTLPSSQLTGLS